MSLLEVKNLHKKYYGKETYALQGVSFELKTGKLLSIIGESGCGKTTLMRILAGLEEKTKGNALLNGERIKGPLSKLVAGHDDIEIVQQDFDLFPNHKVREILQFKLRFYNEEYQEARINELLNLCNLHKEATKTPKELSGGQEQRVALAQALADEPKLILMDEPFSHLDVVLKRQLKSEIVEIIKKTNTAFIFVTHDTEDALSISDQIAVMQDGRLIQMGTPNEIYNFPKTPYIASFFGSPSIFSVKELNEFIPSIPITEQMACLRSEAIQINSNGEFTGKVNACYYHGYRYQIIIQATTNLQLTSFSKTPIAVGASLNFDINQDKLHFFNEK